MSSVDDSYDVVVIGAGPHALSLVCRLVDDEPDLLDEAARSHIMSKAGSRGRHSRGWRPLLPSLR